VYCACL